MAYRIRITPAALANAEEIYLWLNDGNASTATEWFNGLFEAFDSLKTMPKRCAIAPETELVGVEVRCLYYRKVYKIFFCIDADMVIIHHICHTSRDYPTVEEFYGSTET
ncbi:MAG: type II toxin-antitoxin system RelE/ParE family toxin [Leptolyngbya sp. Prado105]|jgi:plasmid stabilization system protein ParE|nr:type II toxin-antitoxin system RelE/ParE family toxin [Leptolyngbya sp. Prado105]